MRARRDLEHFVESHLCKLCTKYLNMILQSGRTTGFCIASRRTYLPHREEVITIRSESFFSPLWYTPPVWVPECGSVLVHSTSGPSTMPVASCSACGVAWHRRDSPVLQCAEHIVPVAGTYSAGIVGWRTSYTGTTSRETTTDAFSMIEMPHFR